MDFSNYPEEHPNYSRKNHLVPGKFKDEGGSVPFTEGFFLRSKMYHITSLKDENSKSTAKGITRSARQQQLKEDAYRGALFSPEMEAGKKLKMSRIASEKHRVFLMSQQKVGLSPYNDKVYIERKEDQWTSLSFGHYRIQQ